MSSDPEMKRDEKDAQDNPDCNGYRNLGDPSRRGRILLRPQVKQQKCAEKNVKKKLTISLLGDQGRHQRVKNL
jgi:hypothetical protein